MQWTNNDYYLSLLKGNCATRGVPEIAVYFFVIISLEGK